MSLVEIVRIALALMVPWSTGVLCVALALPSDGEGRRASAIGFGFPVGMLIVIVAILGQGALGWQHQFGLTLLATGLVGLLPLAWLLSKSRRFPWAVSERAESGVRAVIFPFPIIVLMAGISVLILFKLLLIGQEIWLRPLFPWDAWNFHAQQARLWAEYGTQIEFTRDWSQRLSSSDDSVYVQFGYNLHPPGLSLIQLWMIETLPSYDDALINLPWFVLAVSLCAAMYGQVRMHGGTQVAALLATYGFISLPVVYTHLALAGYADIWISAFLFMAISAFLMGLSKPRIGTSLLFLFGLAGMLLLKQSGLFWLPVVLAVLVFGFGGFRRGAVFCLICLLAFLCVQLWLGYDVIGKFTSGRLADGRHELSIVAVHLGRNLFTDANWHLLWYLFPVALICSLRFSEMHNRVRLSLLVFVILGLAALFYAFFFTRAGMWVINGGTVNRVLLHLVPVIVLWLALTAEGITKRLHVMPGG